MEIMYHPMTKHQCPQKNTFAVNMIIICYYMYVSMVVSKHKKKE